MFLSVTNPLETPWLSSRSSGTIRTSFLAFQCHLRWHECIDESKQPITESPNTLYQSFPSSEWTEPNGTGVISLVFDWLHFLLHVSERAHVRDVQGNPKNNISLLKWCWPQVSYFGNVVLPLVDDILRMLHTWKAKNMLYPCVFTFTAYHLPYFWNLDCPQSSWLPKVQVCYVTCPGASTITNWAKRPLWQVNPVIGSRLYIHDYTHFACM